ncbi:hypothetical protein P691DRAFT_819538 [Macrolepiota fuliginosa MF-IS2]|uniref:Uncharacterized protein n=1 Tax=Macrolepiota fuliginosa MF-IS2 TaxID=1400762 RepID=A0A9P6C3T2_9AGAR|nr:hypothetical protein P691DRAFT_819538 [Macrolepiota fuliginosa MF-IS2]
MVLYPPAVTPSNEFEFTSGIHLSPRHDFLQVAQQCPPVRTLHGIVWSCLATMFACTWVAMHPSVPTPELQAGSWWPRLKCRIVLAASALIAPECMLLWAVRERILAEKIYRFYNKRFLPDTEIGASTKHWTHKMKWTLAHGFLVLMDGFALHSDKGEYIDRIAPSTLFRRLETEEVTTLVTISQEEIEDKSKGDFFTKLVVAIQTTWFIVQCIGRTAAQLPLMELEVMTLAFAVLNIITYTLWWHKPQNIGVAVPISTPEPTLTGPPPVAIDNDGGGLRSDTPPAIPPTLYDNRKTSQSRSLSFPMDMACDVHSQFYCLPEPFHLDPLKELLVLVSFFIVAALFGGVHLSAWSSSFPTSLEVYLWRSAAVCCTLIPLLVWFPLGLSLYPNIQHITGGAIQSLPSSDYNKLVQLPSSFAVYLIARLVLITVAFSSLRSPSTAQLMDVVWSRFIPHL